MFLMFLILNSRGKWIQYDPEIRVDEVNTHWSVSEIHMIRGNQFTLIKDLGLNEVLRNVNIDC